MARRKGPRSAPLMARVEPEIKTRFEVVAQRRDESVAKIASRAMVIGLEVIEREEVGASK